MSDCGSCQSFSAEFQKKTTAARTPIQATIELTYRCNFDCVHCYNVKHWVGGELTLAEWKGVFDQLADAGCLMLTFSGGEPLVHPDFFAIVEAARERRFAFRLLTNASLIDEAAANRLADLAPLSVDVSFYGADPETFGAVTKRVWLQDRVYDGVRRLRARGIPVTAKVPLLRENFEDRFALEALAQELGCTIRANAEITPKDDGDRSPQEHALTGEQLMVWLREVEAAKKAAGTTASVRPFRPDDRLCLPGESALAIGPFGDVFPCIQIKKSMGNLRHTSFQKIWRQSEPLEEIRGLRAHKFEDCSECSAFGAGGCKPCLGVSWLENGTLTGANSESCRREMTLAVLRVL